MTIPDFSSLFAPQRVEVPCGACRQCCQGNSIVILLPDEGDDVESYEHEVIELEASRLGPLDHLAGRGAILKSKENGDCVYLGPEGCTIRDRAPVICRAFDCRLLLRGRSRGELRKMIAQGLLDQKIVDRGRELAKERGRNDG